MVEADRMKEVEVGVASFQPLASYAPSSPHCLLPQENWGAGNTLHCRPEGSHQEAPEFATRAISEARVLHNNLA